MAQGTGSKSPTRPPSGGAAAARREQEEERRRTKHGLVRDRLPMPMPRRAAIEPVPEPEPEEDEEEDHDGRAELDDEAAELAPELEAPPPSTLVAPPSSSAPLPMPPQPATGLLDVGEPGDRLEEEADEAAERVLRRLAASPGGAPVAPPPPPAPFARGQLIQRSSLVEVAAEAAGLTPRTETPGGLIVEDRTETLTPGQMKKTPFLARLREVVWETADRELRRVGRSPHDCPYIEEVQNRLARRAPDQIERMIRRYAPETRQATRAEDYFAPVATHLAQGIAAWARTGRVPDNLPGEFRPGRLSGLLFAGAALGRSVGSALFKGKDGDGAPGVDAAALADRLGPGRPLDGGARSRMEQAFGHSFGDVRIHSDDSAAALSRDLRARAFTVGSHVAFGAGEYNPGTLVGDALLAHELAHVVQQQGGTPAPPSPLDPNPAQTYVPPDHRRLAWLLASNPEALLPRQGHAHELDADAAAAGAMVELYAPAKSRLRKLLRRKPRVRTGMQLARCDSCNPQAQVRTPPQRPAQPPFQEAQPLTREAALARRQELMDQFTVLANPPARTADAPSGPSFQDRITTLMTGAGAAPTAVTTVWPAIQRGIAAAATRALEDVNATQRTTLEMLSVAARLEELGAADEGGSLRAHLETWLWGRLLTIEAETRDRIVTSTMTAIQSGGAGTQGVQEAQVRTAVEEAIAYDRIRTGFGTRAGLEQIRLTLRRQLIEAFTTYRTGMTDAFQAAAGVTFGAFFTADDTGVHRELLTPADLATRRAAATTSVDAGHLHIRGQTTDLVQQMLGQIYDLQATSFIAHRLVQHMIAGQAGGRTQHRDVTLEAVSSTTPMVLGDSFASNLVDPQEFASLNQPARPEGMPVGASAGYAHVLSERQYDAINIEASREELDRAARDLQTDFQALIDHPDCPAHLRSALLSSTAAGARMNEEDLAFIQRVRPGFAANATRVSQLLGERFALAHQAAVEFERAYYNEQGLEEPAGRSGSFIMIVPRAALPGAEVPPGLPVSRPSDPLEQQADAAAAAALRRLADPQAAPATASRSAAPAGVQRASLIEIAARAAGREGDAGGGLIVTDETETLTGGQMKKTPFLAEMRRRACDVAEQEMRRAGRSSQPCTYIDEILGRFAGRPPDALERAVRRYAPDTRGAQRAEDYFAPVERRLTQGIATWVRTGRVPEGLPTDPGAAGMSGFLGGGAATGRAAAGAARALFKSKDGAAGRGGVDAGALTDRLGPGRPLDAGARGRMEQAFGHSFGDVRIHADAGAAQLSGDLQARAFTVGPHIAFGPGEYRPGTPVGDALLAHELAHVIQQEGAAPVAARDLEHAPQEHEHDADEATVGALVEMYAPPQSRWRKLVRRAKPRLRSAMHVSRCSTCGGGARPARDTIPDAFAVTGAARHPSDLTHIFFERNASEPDEHQVTTKIAVLVGPGGTFTTTNLRITGNASEDEPETLALERAQAVARKLEENGHGGTRAPIAAPVSARRRIDYREVRSVTIEDADAPTAVPTSPVAPCADNEPVFQTARAAAAAMVRTARDTLHTPIAATPLDPNVDTAFRTLFGPPDDTRVGEMRTNLDNLQNHIDTDMAPETDDAHRPGHQCGTAAHDGCIRGWDAQNSGVGTSSMVTLCASFFGRDPDVQARMLVHEGSHGTAWIGASVAGRGTVDVAYQWHRIMPFLRPEQGFRNADSVSVFVAAVQPGASLPTLGPTGTAADTWEPSDTTHESSARRAVAFLQQRLTSAQKFVSQLHNEMLDAPDGGAFTDTRWTITSETFGAAHGFSSTGSGVTEGDRFRVAGLNDRIDRCRNRLRRPVTLRLSEDPTTTWDSGPGAALTLGQDFVHAADHEAQLQIIIRAMFTATEGIPADLVTNYVTYMERIRVHVADPIADDPTPP
jgi:hypothetical protein